MRQFRTTMFAAVALFLFAGPHAAPAQDTCAGDCDSGGAVAINELVICVNIALGSAAVTGCAPCDVNGDESVAINELIAAVNAALGGCTPVGGDEVCGDGEMNVAGETCDDGNNQGGDGCAANCTVETRRVTELDPAKAKATAQIRSIAIPLNLRGTQTLTVGALRDVAVKGKDGTVIYQPGQMPVILKAADVNFDPISISGLACACVRGVAVEAFGAGVSGTGVLGCGADGLTDINVKTEQDHDTTPGSPGNSGTAAGLPDDPECDDTSSAGTFINSTACLEGTGATCSTENSFHVGRCNSPRVVTFSGGRAVRGSVLMVNSSGIGLLQDGGLCTTTKPMRNGKCQYADYGADCLPCTADDLQQGTPSIAPTTSGTAEVVIYDVSDNAGATIGAGANCGSTPCVTKVTGTPADCDAIAADVNAPLHASLVTAFPSLDAAMVGDTLVTATFAAK